MPYSPLSNEAVNLINKESPVFRRFRLGTMLQNLLAAVVTVTGVETLTNKTLTTPTINTPTINTPTINTPTINTPAITGGTIVSSAITAPDLYITAAEHNYAGDAADWELSAAEAKASILAATNATGACAIIATPDLKMYWVKNGTGQELTIKADGQTGVKIANGKTAAVYGNGTDFIRLTADL
jgi:hypothetical protein